MERLVEFPNRSGATLRGMIHQPPLPEAGTCPGVVFLHGFTGDRVESHWLFVKASRALERAGIASLRFDFFGSAESDGEFVEASLETELADAEAAVNYLRGSAGIDRERVGLVGLSLGGGIAALVADGIGARALVLWAAIARLPDLRWLAERFSRPLSGSTDGAREFGGHEVTHAFLEAADRLDPVASLSRFTRPTLIIHPSADEYLDLTHPEAYYQACASPVKEKVIIPGADHTFTSVDWEREVISRTVAWHQTYL